MRIFTFRKPMNYVILADILAFTVLYMFKDTYDWRTLLEGLAIIILISISYYLILKLELGDEYPFLIVSMLSSIGVIMIYRLDISNGLKQIVWLIVGIILFFGSYTIFTKFKYWSKYWFVYAGLSVFLFLFTLVFGSNINGAKNWILIGSYGFQPSEIIKILFVMFMASYFQNPKALEFKYKNIRINDKLVFLGISYVFLGFLVLQTEWGTTLLLFMMFFFMIYIFWKSKLILLLNAACAAFGTLGGYLFLEHIKIRVDMWLNPWSDIAGRGYQITQSLFAIAEGGFFGKGLGLGRPDYIPAVDTDFIFSAICEEMGIFGGVAVVLLFFILTYRGFKIALKCKDTFSKVVALGITFMYGFQTFIIIGGVIKLIPLTGITLPFVSYGGSSLITGFIALGILQAVSASGQREEEAETNG